MKKLLLIAVLMLALVVTAVACTETPADEETTTAAPETTVAEETTVEETTEEETTLEETTEEETTEEETTEEETTEEETLPYVTDATATNKSYDTFFANGEMYFEQDGQADVKLGLQNNTVEFAAGEYCYSIALRGWIGFSQPIAQFGYFINDGEFVFADEFKAPTEDAVLGAGGPNASRFHITAPLGELGGGTYQVGFVAKLEDGTVVLLYSVLTVTFSDPYVKDTAAGGAMSYDTFFANGEMYFPQDGQAAVKLELQNNTVEFAAGAAHDSIALRGWIGFSQPIAQFGYFIDTYDFVYGDFKQATEDAVLGAGGPNASRFNITVPMADLAAGTYKVGFVAQLEDGTVVLLNAVLTIVIKDVEILTYTEAQTAGLLVGFQWIQYLVDEAQTVQAWGCNGIDGKNPVDAADQTTPVTVDPYTLPAGTTSFGYYGWFGISDNCDTDPCDMFYSLDGGEYVYGEDFMTDSNTGALALLPGATSAPNVRVIVDLTGLTGEHTVEILYKSANGTLVLMDTINLVIEAAAE